MKSNAGKNLKLTLRNFKNNSRAFSIMI